MLVGDDWNDCLVPMILKYSWMFVVLIFMSVQLGFLNLILSVIVEKASDAREADLPHKVREKNKARLASAMKLIEALRKVDTQKNGAITKSEFLEGYDTNEGLRCILAMLSISREEIGELFNCLDTDDTGSVQYMDFVSHFERAQSQDHRVQLHLLRMEIHKLLKRRH